MGNCLQAIQEPSVCSHSDSQSFCTDMGGGWNFRPYSLFGIMDYNDLYGCKTGSENRQP